MSAALKSRLVRLERKSQARRSPRVIAYIYDMDPNRIVGFRGGGTFGENQCDRKNGEAVSDLISRSFDLVGSTFLAAIYSADAHQDAPEDDLPPSPGNSPSEAASPCVGIPADPYALAGIGRRATRAELERMSALRVPPKRFI